MFVESKRFRRIVQSLFRRKGLRAIGHLVRRLNLQDRIIEVDDFDRDLRFRCFLNEHIGSHMYWRGAYSWPQLEVLRGILRDGMVFLDVGANQGEFSLFAAKRLPNGQVWAFEPLAEMFERLRYNIEMNGFSNVHAVSLGLSSGCGQKPLFTSRPPFYDGSVHEGLGTLFASDERSLPVQNVSLTTLDAFAEERGIDRVDVIKIDIEGGEYEALIGAEKTIDANRPIMLMEASRSNLRAAGCSLEALLAYLRHWYSFELIRSNGTTSPVHVGELGEHQDLLCRPL